MSHVLRSSFLGDLPASGQPALFEPLRAIQGTDPLGEDLPQPLAELVELDPAALLSADAASNGPSSGPPA